MASFMISKFTVVGELTHFAFDAIFVSVDREGRDSKGNQSAAVKDASNTVEQQQQ
jgi:hypothetical protein